MSRLTLVPERRDSLGRRIGWNWWREMNCEARAGAESAWQQGRESATPVADVAGTAHSAVACYQLSEVEYRERYPRPNLKDFLIANSGQAERLCM